VAKQETQLQTLAVRWQPPNRYPLSAEDSPISTPYSAETAPLKQRGLCHSDAQGLSNHRESFN